MELIQLKNKDGNPLLPVTTAEGVIYDPTKSGLEAQDVQNAITEANNKWRIKIETSNNSNEGNSESNPNDENINDQENTEYESQAQDLYETKRKYLNVGNVGGKYSGVYWDSIGENKNKYVLILKPNSEYKLTWGFLKSLEDTEIKNLSHSIHIWKRVTEGGPEPLNSGWYTSGNTFYYTRETKSYPSSINGTRTYFLENTQSVDSYYVICFEFNNYPTGYDNGLFLEASVQNVTSEEPGGDTPIEPEPGGGGDSPTPSEDTIQYIEFNVETLLEEVDRRIEEHDIPSVQIPSSASDISFNPITSTLTRNTVQEAIEEVNTKIESIDISSSSSDISNIWENITSVWEGGTRPFVMNVETGKFNQELGSVSGYSRNFYKVEPGDKIKFSFKPCASYSYAYYIVGANDMIITAGVQPSGNFDNQILDIPIGAEAFIFNYHTTTDQQVFIKRNKNNSLIKDALYKESDLVGMSEKRNIEGDVKNKIFTLAWISDTHGDRRNYRRFAEYVNAHAGIIDGVIHTGDINRMSATDEEFSKTVGSYPVKVPFMPVMGNHDSHGSQTGSASSNNCRQVLSSGSSSWQASQYVTPFVSGNNCNQGINSESNKDCYFYRDFPQYKIRVICLNDYDAPRIVSNSNWKTTMDPSEISNAPLWVKNHVYQVGDVINYKGLYLKCYTSSILEDNGDYNNTSNYTQPRSAKDVSGRYLQQEQVNFLLDALSGLPSDDWGIIIATHMPIENYKSSQNIASNNWHDKNSHYLPGGTLFAQSQRNSYESRKYLLSDILAAFTGRLSINHDFYAMSSTHTDLGTASADYAGQDVSVSIANDETYTYNKVTVSKDFSQAKGHIICCLNGHTHTSGCYWLKYTVKPDIPLPFGNYVSNSESNNPYQILNISQETGCYMPDSIQQSATNYKRFNASDIIRGGSLAQDCFNVISYDNVTHEIQLLRIGADTTDKHVKRDYARITIPVTQGTTSNRPTLTTTDSGYTYYDMSLKKIIKWNGTDWINLDGTSL